VSIGTFDHNFSKKLIKNNNCFWLPLKISFIS